MSSNIKSNALAQARELGKRDGATGINATSMVDVVDVVSQCPAVGSWLDTLTSRPAAFNRAHHEVADAYRQGYGEGEAETTDNWTKRIEELRQMVADVPVAPECASDADYYITTWGIKDMDEIKFLRQEFARQYAPGIMHKWEK